MSFRSVRGVISGLVPRREGKRAVQRRDTHIRAWRPCVQDRRERECARRHRREEDGAKKERAQKNWDMEVGAGSAAVAETHFITDLWRLQGGTRANACGLMRTGIAIVLTLKIRFRTRTIANNYTGNGDVRNLSEGTLNRHPTSFARRGSFQLRGEGIGRGCSGSSAKM